MKLFKTLIICVAIILPISAISQEEPDPLAPFRRTIFNLQQDMLQMQDQLDRQTKELRSQKENLTLQVERLNEQNRNMRRQLQEMDSLIFQMEDKLESSSLVHLQKELNNLRNFNKSIILNSLNQTDQAEKLLLDILNQPDTKLSKDLLVLLLAQQKKQAKQYDESVSYYSTLLSEFANSIYFSQAIYELAEVFGETERKEQQITLLAQLASLSDTEFYSLRALEKLKELGADELFEKEALEPDATADIQTASEDSQPIEKSIPESSLPETQPIAEDSEDATSDSLPVDATPLQTDAVSDGMAKSPLKPDEQTDASKAGTEESTENQEEVEKQSSEEEVSEEEEKQTSQDDVAEEIVKKATPEAPEDLEKEEKTEAEETAIKTDIQSADKSAPDSETTNTSSEEPSASQPQKQDTPPATIE